MLPFGSFLSNIPLIIIAAAYLLYFGASVVNKPKSEEDPGSPEKVQIARIAPLHENSRSINYITLLQDKSIICENKGITIFSDLPIPLHFLIPDRKIFSYSGGYNLCPPPLVARQDQTDLSPCTFRCTSDSGKIDR